MQPDLSAAVPDDAGSAKPTDLDRAASPAKPPRQILPGVFAFPPNREALGGTAYLIVEKYGNILIDCPAWTPETAEFLQQHGGLRQVVLTHRDGGRSAIAPLQAAFDCTAVVQEQEAYLLPEATVASFGAERELSPDCWAFWTPGYSPGSTCVYLQQHGGLLFSGRHLLPDPQGRLTLLRRSKTFHWFRQLRSAAALRDRFNAETLAYICPGAHTGWLRGEGAIAEAYTALAPLDLQALRAAAIGS